MEFGFKLSSRPTEWLRERTE